MKGIASDVVWGSGLLRSSDKGITWSKVSNFDYYARGIVTLNNYLYAVCGDDGVYRSLDYGLTWMKCMNGIDSILSKNWTFDQLEIMKTADMNYIFLKEYNEFFRSTDNGDSWQKITDKLTSSPTYLSAMTTTIDNKIYVACDSAFFCSSDFGDSWTKINDGLQSFSSLDVYALKSDKNGNVYAAGYFIGIIRLKHNETTWELIHNGLVPYSAHEICFDNSTNEIFAATNGGIYKSTNDGNNWLFYNEGVNLPMQVRSIAISKNGDIFAGTENNGIYLSTDDGNSWKTVNNGITDSYIRKIKIDSKGNIYAGTINGLIFKSSNNGSSFEKLEFGNTAQYSTISDLAISSQDYILPIVDCNNTIEKDTLIISKDGGNNWEKIYFPYNTRTSVIFDKNDNIFISNFKTVYRSVNNGISWEEVLKQDNLISNFYVSKNNTIFAGYRFNGILRSTDEGNTWVNLTQGFSKDSEINCIISPDMENSIICGTTFNGYYVSNDSGYTWINFHQDLPSPDSQIALEEFRDFAYDGDGTLYAATHSGVYKWVDVTSGIAIIQNKSQFEIFPNPATDYIEINLGAFNTTLKRGVAEGSDIQIIDMLGVIVLTVEQTSQSVQRIDVTILSPGIYFLKIGNRVEKFVKI